MQGLKTSSKMSTSVKTLPFDGKREKWREWNLKVLAFAGKHNFKKALMVDQIPFSEPTLGDGATIAEIASQTERRHQHEQDLVDAKSQNEDAYNFLTLSCTGVAFTMVEAAKGDARKAWIRFIQRYESDNEEEVVALLSDFQNCKMQPTQHPDEFIMELEYLNDKIAKATNDKIRKSEHELKAHVIANVTKDYSQVVTTTDGKLSQISLDELSTKLRLFYLRTFEKKAKTEESTKQNIALAVSDNVNKMKKKVAKFKGICKNCGKYGHKAEDCWNHQKNMDIKEKDKPKSSGPVPMSEKKCYRCGGKGHIAKDCPTKNKETGMFVAHVRGMPKSDEDISKNKVITKKFYDITDNNRKFKWADWEEEESEC